MSDFKPGDLVIFKDNLGWPADLVGEVGVFVKWTGQTAANVWVTGKRGSINCYIPALRPFTEEEEKNSTLQEGRHP